MDGRSSGPNLVDVLVGKNVILKRIELDLSQAHLANELGLTVDEYLEYESGARRFGAERIAKLARLMNVSPGYFFEGLPSPGGRDSYN
jgi:transcriptional regulator with XRE-family HTH domain